MILGIYCAGGFGKEVFDIASRQNGISQEWEKIIFIDDFASDDSAVYLTRSYKFDSISSKFDISNLEIVIANGEPFHKQVLFDKVKQAGYRFARVQDPTAIVSPSAEIGHGVIIASFCIIASNSKIGNNVAINVHSIIGHDIEINDHVILSSMVNIGGFCQIDTGTYIGMNAQIKDGLRIGKDAIIGMGAVVHHNIESDIIALGNPARPMRRNTEKRVFKS